MFERLTHDTETAVLDAVRSERATADAAEARLLALACDWADLHPADSIDDAAVLIRGGDTALAIAGAGAPLVSEFAIAEYAAALRVPTRVGKERIGLALELRHRLSRVWARVMAGDLPAWRARRIAETTMGLSFDAAAYVDSQIAAFAHRVGPAETERLVADATARFMPELADELHRKAMDGRHVTIGTHIHWGDQWRERVDSALANVAFFIPVLTPRYFTRPECRREFLFFWNKVEDLGVEELILPILYIDVPELQEDDPSDPIMKILKEIQWEPWLDFRFEDRASGAYRQAVNALAAELVRRVAVVERADVLPAVQTADDLADSSQGDGTLDRMAALEGAMPRWNETLEAITAEIERIGNLMTDSAGAMEVGENQGKGFAARLTVARRLSQDLAEPIERIESLGQQFAVDLSEIDAGVRTFFELIEEQAEALADDDEKSVQSFLSSVRGLAESADEGLGSIQGMIEAAEPLEAMSRDMRGPLRRLRASLTAMLEARTITGEWLSLLDGLESRNPSIAAPAGHDDAPLN